MAFRTGLTVFILIKAIGLVVVGRGVGGWVGGRQYNSLLLTIKHEILLKSFWLKIEHFFDLKPIFIALDLHYNVFLLGKWEGVFITVEASIRINTV